MNLAPILTSVCISNSTQDVFGANAAQILEGHCQEFESSSVVLFWDKVLQERSKEPPADLARNSEWDCWQSKDFKTNQQSMFSQVIGYAHTFEWVVK